MDIIGEMVNGQDLADATTTALLWGLIVLVVTIIPMWKIFTKAGYAGWKAIIPFYNFYILCKIAWKPMAFWIFLILTFLTSLPGLYNDSANMPVAFILLTAASAIALIVFSIMLCIKLSRSFGHGGGYAVGLIFLSLIFEYVIAFGSSEYVGPEGEKVAVKAPAKKQVVKKNTARRKTTKTNTKKTIKKS